MQWVWHYTPLAHAESILQSGRLLPSNARAEREIPLLWFSCEQRWEPTAGKLVVAPSGRLKMASWEEQLRVYGVFRLGLSEADSRLLHWSQACKAARTPRKERLGMEQQGRLLGANPARWRACLQSLQISELSVQCLDAAEQWTPCSLEDVLASWNADQPRQHLLQAMLVQVASQLRKAPGAAI